MTRCRAGTRGSGFDGERWLVTDLGTLPDSAAAVAHAATLVHPYAPRRRPAGDSVRDPRPAIERAYPVGARCLALDPHCYALLEALMQVQLALAQSLVESKHDPMPASIGAQDALGRSETVQHDQITVWYHRLIVANLGARLLLRSGRATSRPSRCTSTPPKGDRPHTSNSRQSRPSRKRVTEPSRQSGSMTGTRASSARQSRSTSS